MGHPPPSRAIRTRAEAPSSASVQGNTPPGPYRSGALRMPDPVTSYLKHQYGPVWGHIRNFSRRNISQSGLTSQ
jgi:hypothetical protein